MGAAAVAFAAWALSLPKTPLRDACSYDVSVGAFIVLAGTIGIGMVAAAAGKQPPSSG